MSKKLTIFLYFLRIFPKKKNDNITDKMPTKTLTVITKYRQTIALIISEDTSNRIGQGTPQNYLQVREQL